MMYYPSSERTNVYFIQRVCPICNKMFHTTNSMWGYTRRVNRDKTLYFCSYSCMRTYERPKLAAQNRLIDEEFRLLENRESKCVASSKRGLG